MKLNKIIIASGFAIACAGVLVACNSTVEKSEKDMLVPADKFDLSKWKMTIPTDKNNDGKVDSVSVKKIQTFQHPDFFYLDDEGNMVFASPNKAFTTPNSTNTRSELHQVISGTAGNANELTKNFALPVNKRADQFGQLGGNLQATLKVNHVAKRATYPEKAPAFSVVVGQIHATKDKSLVEEGEGYGYGNEPLKIYFKKWPNHEYGSVFWNYERNLEKENPDRKDISYAVWGNDWSQKEAPGKAGIALDEAFSYEIDVHDNIMYLTFNNARHGTKTFEIDLSNNVDANGEVDALDHPKAYSGDAMFFKAGAYNQCSIKDDPGFWYPKCLGTGEWETDKANGDYAQVSFMRLETGPSKRANK